MLASAGTVLGQIQASHLIAVAGRGLTAIPALRQSLAAVRTTLRQLGQTLLGGLGRVEGVASALKAQLARSLDLQCRLLAHTISLDRKTLGPAPPATGAGLPGWCASRLHR